MILWEINFCLARLGVKRNSSAKQFFGFLGTTNGINPNIYQSETAAEKKARVFKAWICGQSRVTNHGRAYAGILLLPRKPSEGWSFFNTPIMCSLVICV